jgi:maltoporin
MSNENTPRTQSLLAVLCLAVVTALATSCQMVFAGTSEQNRAVGFSDGCNHVPMTGHHTQAYMDGYNQGAAKCSSQGSAGSSAASSSASTSSSNGNSVTLNIQGLK